MNCVCIYNLNIFLFKFEGIDLDNLFYGECMFVYNFDSKLDFIVKLLVGLDLL